MIEFKKDKEAAKEVVLRILTSRVPQIVLMVAPTAPHARTLVDKIFEIYNENEILSDSRVRPVYEQSKGLVNFPNGAKILLHSSEEPDRMRGMNSHLLWVHAPGSWISRPSGKFQLDAFDIAQLCNRLGENPEMIVSRH